MNTVDITLDNAQQYIIDESFQRPVMVDFWADWCGPCKSLTPILEKLADEYAGSFLLAKINADEQQMLASQFGVRSLPTVMLLKDGQPLDGFSGAKTENEVRELLDQHLPKAWEALFERATAHLSSGDAEAALPLLRQAHSESGGLSRVACTLAQALVELNRCDQAQDVLDAIPASDRDALYEKVCSQLELAQQAAQTPEILALEKAREADPTDLSTAFDLAEQYSRTGQHRPALELLVEILSRDRDFHEGEAKQLMLGIIAELGKGDPLAAEFQRRLFTLMY